MGYSLLFLPLFFIFYLHVMEEGSFGKHDPHHMPSNFNFIFAESFCFLSFEMGLMIAPERERERERGAEKGLCKFFDQLENK